MLAFTESRCRTCCGYRFINYLGMPESINNDLFREHLAAH